MSRTSIPRWYLTKHNKPVWRGDSPICCDKPVAATPWPF